MQSNDEEKKESKEKVGDEEKDDEKKEVNPDEMQPQQKLFYFAKQGDVDGVKGIGNSADINAVDDIGFKHNPYITKNTALHYAVESGSLECVKVLYNLEAKLDITNKLKSTPLHIAASLGHTEIVEFLIKMKANIEAKNIVSNTPLHCAVYAGHTDTVRLILSKLDEPRDALLEPNGVGMGAAKYTAHDDMKALLRTYFPKRNMNNNSKDTEDKPNNNIEEEPPQSNTTNDQDNVDNNDTNKYED